MSNNAIETPEGTLYGVLAEFESPGALIDGAEAVRDAGFTKWDCYSPFPVHGIDPAMGIKRTILPWIVFAVGLSGLCGGLLLQWWTNAYDWPWLVSGKPLFSLPANIPITFETTVLASALATFFGMWTLNRLPKVWHPFFRSERFVRVTNDGFFLGIEADDAEFAPDETVALLEEAGAVAVEHIHLDPDPAKKRIPKLVIAFVIFTTVLALIPFALIAKARSSHTDKPHLHIIPDMDFQFRHGPQTASDLFDDQRASRAGVEGTVAQGELKDDDHFYRGFTVTRDDKGQAVNTWKKSFPPQIEMSRETMDRGRTRYNIFCAPCHGMSGMGDGMINKRAKEREGTWAPPTSIHAEHVIKQPHGQLYNTISNGVRTMPGYAVQIPEADRWAIVLYLRALQRSQLATVDDAPAGKAPAPTAPPAPKPEDETTPPAEGADAPADGADGADAPAEGADAPAEGADAPAEGADAPADGADAPAEGAAPAGEPPAPAQPPAGGAP